MRIFKTYVVPALIVLGILAVDQISKFLAVQNLPYREEVPVIDGVFSLFYLRNEGMAFGLLQGQRWLFIGLTVLILAFLVYFYTTLPQNKVGRAYRFSILVLIGGALGNFVDRLFQGQVVDFFLITAINFPWVFNVADIFVVTSVAAMAVLTFFLKEEDLKKWKFKKNA